jgi:hypothetical protein
MCQDDLPWWWSAVLVLLVGLLAAVLKVTLGAGYWA